MSKRSTRRREIERLLSLRESSGHSLREFADRSGIPAGTLSWWSHRLRQEASDRAFAEVVVDGRQVGDRKKQVKVEKLDEAQLREFVRRCCRPSIF